jgi:hypothetical protein
MSEYDDTGYDQTGYETYPGEGLVREIIEEGEHLLEDFTEPLNERPIAVKQIGESKRSYAAEFGSWITYTLNAAAGRTQVLKRNPRRDRATIVVIPTVVAQTATDGAIVGTMAQCSQTSQPAGGAGGFLPLNEKIVIQNQQELYAVFPTSNTSPVYVTVLDETYNE